MLSSVEHEKSFITSRPGVSINIYWYYVWRSIIGTLANSVDPDQTPQSAASDQGLHCLHYEHEFL